GVEVLDLPAAHGLGEVAVVVALRVELLDLLAVQVVGHATLVVRADHVALLAVEDVADRAAAQAVRLQAAHLEDELAVAVVEDADLRVGRLAVIDIPEPAADADDGARELALLQAPPGLVHLVDALVAEVAVAVVPDPVPVVVDGAELRGVAVRHLQR